MAYREVTMIEVKEVLRQWLSGAAKRAIARRVGLDRNTVRRYLEAAGDVGLRRKQGVDALTDELLAQVLEALRPAAERPHGEAWARCEAQREFISKKVKQGVKLSKVCRLLTRMGVQVPYPTLHRFAVTELDFGRAAPTIPVADCEPGQELQLDTGWMGHLEPDEQGKRRRFRAWIFTSVCTRHRFVYPAFRESTEEAIRACEAAWGFFGGVFRVLIPDNTKAIVQKADSLYPLINETFWEYAQARGFVIDPTRIRSPKDKARVERAVQPTRDDCFAGEVLRNLDDAHKRAVTWCLHEYGMRRHSRTQRLPLEHFEAEEKACLLPVPTMAFEIPAWSSPKVHTDQHAQVAKALYSLPRHLKGKRLRARADRTTVRFYFDRKLVKTHPRMPPGRRSTDPADFPPEQAALAMRDLAFIERQAYRHGDPVGRLAHALLEGPLPWTRMRRVYALLGLCRRYGDARVAEACRTALEAEMHDLRRLERMLQLGPAQPPSKSQSAQVIPLCRYLRQPQQYALPLASHKPDPKPQGGEDP